MTNLELNQLLIRSLPQLKDLYEAEVGWQEGDKTGSHIVFGDVFTPYLERNLQDREDVKICFIFDFIERLLGLNDDYCDEVIAFSVLERLHEDPEKIKVAVSYMGKKTLIMCEEVRKYLGK